MKSTDSIDLQGNSLSYAFHATGETGSSGLLRLDRSLRIFAEGNAVYAENDAGAKMCVENFSTAKLASSAHGQLTHLVQRYLKRRSRQAKLRAGLKVVGFTALTLYLVAIYGTVAGLGSQMSVASAPASFSPQEALRALNALQGSSAIGAPAAAQPGGAALAPTASIISPATAKKLLAIGAAPGGGFSLQLSSGSKGTLYVFADPACPACQALEPQLATLGRNYTIHIFPVSVIGREASAKAGAQVLCQPKDAQAAAWTKVMSGDTSAPSVDGPESRECDSGRAAIEQNNAFFRNAGFPGTPMILDENGYLLPETVPHSSHAIAAWLQQPRASSPRD